MYLVTQILYHLVSQIYIFSFHWPILISLAKSIFTGRTYFVKYKMYVSVPENWFSEKSLSEKKALYINEGLPIWCFQYLLVDLLM